MSRENKKPGLSAKLAFITSMLLFAANLLLGIVLVVHSRTAMKEMIDYRMLDIANSAADMLDGDVLGRLEAEDKGTEEYQEINDTLAVFQENIDLKYIYCVRGLDDGSYVFTVDPALEDPGEFGEPVTYTIALERAWNGVPSVDEEPYADAWGRFYSAYSPVFDSTGKVSGVVAVDFSAEWYDEHVAGQTGTVIVCSLISVIVGVIIIIIVTGRLSRQIVEITDELEEMAEDVDELTHDIDPGSALNSSDWHKGDDVQELGRHIHQVKENLHQYVMDINTQANSMITALSSEYRSVYFVDLDKNLGICFRAHSHMDNGLAEGENFEYYKTLKAYAEDFVTDEYKEAFLKFIDPDEVRKGLETERIITLRYMIHRGERESYEMLRMAGVRDPEDRDDKTVHAIGMGFTDVDAETREALIQSQALKDALSAAEGANKAKTAFLSNMSHEIRTPMNAIIGLDRLALSDDSISAETRESLEKIGASAEHLLGIINDILDMSRIEAGKMSLKNEEFSLRMLLDQIDVMIGEQCRDKGIEWRWELRGDAGDHYMGDAVKLRQILINILGNAVKFTPSGGKISFVAERLSHFGGSSLLGFIISDTGIGMDEEFLPRLFEPFSQEDYTTKTKYGSTGLGMSITRNIVEMMNGEISVESKKNVGTTFRVRVSLGDSKHDDVQSMEEAGALGGASKAYGAGSGRGPGGRSQEISGRGVVAKAAGDEAPDFTFKGKRILLAEDMDINAEILRRILMKNEIESEHAINGKLAVKMFADHPQGYYDAILMDMRMPEMDGLEATREIRSMDRPDAADIPIIALTANAFDEDVQRSLQAGLNAHLSKPVEPESLFETLRSLLA